MAHFVKDDGMNIFRLRMSLMTDFLKSMFSDKYSCVVAIFN